MVVFEEVIWLLLLLVCKQEGALSIHLHTYTDTYIYICCCFPLKYSQIRTYRRAYFHKCRNLFWNRVLAQNASFRIWGDWTCGNPQPVMTHDPSSGFTSREDFAITFVPGLGHSSAVASVSVAPPPPGWVRRLTAAASCRNSWGGLPQTWVWLGCPRATSLLHLLLQNQYFLLIIWNMQRKSTCKRFSWSYN